MRLLFIYTHIILFSLRSELFLKHFHQGSAYPAPFAVCGESEVVGMNMPQTLREDKRKL